MRRVTEIQETTESQWEKGAAGVTTPIPSLLTQCVDDEV
jgi:hypothetical protein